MYRIRCILLCISYAHDPMASLAKLPTSGGGLSYCDDCKLDGRPIRKFTHNVHDHNANNTASVVSDKWVHIHAFGLISKLNKCTLSPLYSDQQWLPRHCVFICQFACVMTLYEPSTSDKVLVQVPYIWFLCVVFNCFFQKILKYYHFSKLNSYLECMIRRKWNFNDFSRWYWHLFCSISKHKVIKCLLSCV